MPIYTAKPPPLDQNYYILNGGESEGPYDLPFIEAMALSALVASDVSVSKDGRTGWQPLTSLVPPPPPRVTQNNPPPPPFQAPPPTKESHFGRWAFGAVVVIGIIIYANSSSNPQPTYRAVAPSADTSTYQQPPVPLASPPDTSTTYQPPAARPPPAWATTPAPAEQPVYTPPPPSAPAPAPDPTYTVLDSTGHSYRVSLADYNILGQKEDDMKKLLGAINRLKASRAEESRLIENDRAMLDNTDQAAVDRFNAEVDQYNTSGATLDKWIDSYNGLVQDHNDYLVRVGTPAN